MAPRKVTRHKIQNRPGHDGQGYPDFRISSDDSDNERIIAQKHQLRADRPETKHMSTDMTSLTEKQAKKPVAMRQYSLPRSVFILNMLINIIYYIAHKYFFVLKPKISSTHHHLSQQATAFDSNALRKQTGKHPQQGGAIKPDRLATIRRESIEEQIHPGLPNPRCSPPTQTSSARSIANLLLFFAMKMYK